MFAVTVCTCTAPRCMHTPALSNHQPLRPLREVPELGFAEPACTCIVLHVTRLKKMNPETNFGAMNNRFYDNEWNFQCLKIFRILRIREPKNGKLFKTAKVLPRSREPKVKKSAKKISLSFIVFKMLVVRSIENYFQQILSSETNFFDTNLNFSHVGDIYNFDFPTPVEKLKICFLLKLFSKIFDTTNSRLKNRKMWIEKFKR